MKVGINMFFTGFCYIMMGLFSINDSKEDSLGYYVSKYLLIVGVFLFFSDILDMIFFNSKITVIFQMLSILVFVFLVFKKRKELIVARKILDEFKLD